MTVFSIALVVAVFTALMALATGLDKTFTSSGDPRNVLVIRKSAQVETNSTVTIELSEPLAAETVNSTSVHVLLGDHEVVGSITYADSRIVFTAQQPLALLAHRWRAIG